MKNIKSRTYQILEKANPGDIPSQIFDVFIFALIILNLLAIMLETLPLSDFSHKWLDYFEVFSIVIFSFEYIMRLWSVTANPDYSGRFSGRLHYMITFFALIDLFSILPFYLPAISLFMEIDMRFLRGLRLLRILRIVKIGRYSSSLSVIAKVMKRKRDELFMTLFAAAILIIFSSFVMYYFEKVSQERIYPNLFTSLWWGVVTLTTGGYGDIVPVTLGGRIISAFISLLGVGIVAIPTGIISSGFLEELNQRKDGNLELIKDENHVVFCGYSGTAELVLETIRKKKWNPDIYLFTELENPQIEGLTYFKGDFSDPEVLRYMNLGNASRLVIFAEGENSDMKSVMTAFNARKLNPDIHIIVELQDTEKKALLDNIRVDDIIMGEYIDSIITASAVRHPFISPMLSELVNQEGKYIREYKVHELGFSEKELTYEVVFERALEKNITIIGILKPEGHTVFCPAPDMIITEKDKLVCL